MEHVQLAITMDVFKDRLVNWGLSHYEIAELQMSNEELIKAGVSDPRLYRNLSIFALVFVIMVILLLIFFLCSLIYKQFP